MKEKKKTIRKNSYWENVPEELRLMCLAASHHGGGRYCMQPVLKYLIDHMYDCDSSRYDISIYDVVCWIDKAIETVLFPVEFHDEEWKANRKMISQILNRLETLMEQIRRTAQEECKAGARTLYDRNQMFNAVELAQKLRVYLCILYIYTEEWRKLQKSLNLLLQDTQDNVMQLLSLPVTEAKTAASEDDWAKDFHYPLTDIWDPLIWLGKEYIPDYKAKKMLAHTLEQYVYYLDELQQHTSQTEACEILSKRAEERLRHVCSRILDEIDDCLNDLEETQKALLEDCETFERMLQRSQGKDRRQKERNSQKQDDRTEPDRIIRKKWDGFTKELRKLMIENPSLPVVILSQQGINDDEFTCAASYAHDVRTGEFREKIIAIYRREKNSGDIQLEEMWDDTNLPFH